MQRRKDPRTESALPVRLSFASPNEFLEAYTENVSLGGLFIATHVDVPPGTAVQLTLEFGGGKGLRVRGEVVWQREMPGKGPGIGVRFQDMDPRHKAWLDKALANFAGKGVPSAAPTEKHMLRKATKGIGLAGASDTMGDLQVGSHGEVVLGIDLGTCNSCACAVVEGKPVIVDLGDPDAATKGGKTLPSIVGYETDGRIRIGERALEGLARNAKSTVFGAKRFIGRVYDSPAVQSMLSRFPYKVVPGPQGRVAVSINGRPVSLTAISAKILACIRDRATKQLGSPVRTAVITVPAYYNDNQRDAVVQAGRLAGLTVERVLNEPTAAAIAYGLMQAKPRRLLVYDLGGGTFDVSVMAVERQSLRVLSTAGDTFLGGEDFDTVLLDWVCEQHDNGPKQRLSRNHAALARVKVSAEQAKKRLSTTPSTMVVTREALAADGSTVRVEVELTRDRLEALVKPLVDRTLKICDMALREANMEASDFTDVILVGGQTRMPCVQQRVHKHFGKAPQCDLNPDEVVAMGAGMLASLAPGQADVKDVLSMTIGVAIGSRFKPLIPRNTQVPCRKSFPVTVPRKQFEGYTLDIWQGESPEAHRNEHLGALRVDAVPAGPGKPDDPIRISVDLILSEDCLLKVRVTNTRTNDSQHVLLSTRDST